MQCQKSILNDEMKPDDERRKVWQKGLKASKEKHIGKFQFSLAKLRKMEVKRCEQFFLGKVTLSILE